MTQHTSCDLLIVGGGLSGLVASITAKEECPDLDVLVVEKYTAGYSGKANRGMGIVLMRGDFTVEEFVKYQLDNCGYYFNDQDALLQYAEDLNVMVEDLDRWTGKVSKNPDGSIKTLRWLAKPIEHDENGKLIFDETKHVAGGDNVFPWVHAAVETSFLTDLRKTATKLGVKFVDRTGIVDLLTDDGKICGAVGYNIDTAEQAVFSAKAVLLASRGQNYRISPMWSSGRGEGTYAAWRAGAKMTNCEYSSLYNWAHPESLESNLGVEFALENDKGKDCSYVEGPDITATAYINAYKEVKAGNGPMHYIQARDAIMGYKMAATTDEIWDRPYCTRLWDTMYFNCFSQQTKDEIIPIFLGESGPIKVGLDFQSTVPGLFSAGDQCYIGTRGFGAVPVSHGRMRGAGLGFALYSGRKAGPPAARYAAGAERGTISEDQVAEIDSRFTAPLKRTGSMTVNEFLLEIQKVIQPVANSLYMSDERLEKAIARIQELKDQFDQVEAKEPHHLFGVNELNAMLFGAELFFTAALQRKETRGWFTREDYPETSDEMKWLIVENKDGEFCFSEEEVPIDKYPYKPEQA